MKKFICAILCLTVLFSLSGCNKQQVGTVVPVGNDTLYKSGLTLLRQGNGFVEASCPSSRERLNGRVQITPELLTKLADALSKHEVKPSSRGRVPGDNQELVLQFGEDDGLRIYIYGIESKDETLIWLQNSSERLRLSAQGELYTQLKSILDSAVVSAAPTYDGEYITAQAMPGRDVPRGFYEKNGVMAAAFSSYDSRGFLDFYTIATGELISSIEFTKPLYRLDTGSNGDLRVFSGGKLHYIDMKKREIKQELTLNVKGLDNNDSFDVDEKRKIAAYASEGTIYLCAINGEGAVPIMLTADVSRALPTEITMQIEAEEAVLKYGSPRFIGTELCAMVSSTLASHPLVAMSSFPIEEDITKMLQDEEFARRLSEEFSVVHFPNVFGTMGAPVGKLGSTVITTNDSSYVFSNMISGESWQLPFTWGQRIIPLNGIICTQTQELPEDGLRSRVDISNINSYSNKTQVFAAKATNIEVLGGTNKTLVIRESAASRLLFIDLTVFRQG